MEGINAAQDGFRLLKGIEVDILEDGTLDQTPDMLDRLDVVVASVHSKLRSDKKTMTTRMLGGISDPPYQRPGGALHGPPCPRIAGYQARV